MLHPPARAFFELSCPYADCDGQFDLTAAVDLLLADRLLKAEGTVKCQGHRPGRRDPLLSQVAAGKADSSLTSYEH